MNATVSMWLELFFTICIFSLLLYKDNKLFRFAEIVLVGITAANGIVMTFDNYIKPTIVTDIGVDHKFWYIIPIIMGLFMYTRFFGQIGWLSRIPMGLWLGVGAGYILARQPAVFFSQIRASFLSLNTVNNVIFVVGILSVIVYFFFTVDTGKGPLKVVSEVGKVFLLVTFGAAFANTVASRVSVLLGRMQFILQDVFKLGV
ncbi:MAG TPA: hypothetical protein GYA09_03220 [Firmicutes bacterium]|nr:hypothetical protein [Candidatus Fermentithermobacillaceae bacterium]HQE49940.1 hypothetical protein [Fervidobacterium sp.]